MQASCPAASARFCRYIRYILYCLSERDKEIHFHFSIGDLGLFPPLTISRITDRCGWVWSEVGLTVTSSICVLETICSPLWFIQVVLRLVQLPMFLTWTVQFVPVLWAAQWSLPPAWSPCWTCPATAYPPHAGWSKRRCWLESDNCRHCSEAEKHLPLNGEKQQEREQ